MMPIYFDNNATTTLDERVLEAMLPFLRGDYTGNPSSVHSPGRLVRGAIEQAREQVAQLVNADSNQIIFTSSGSEANNLVIKGFARSQTPAGLLVSPIEHECVLAAAQTLVHDAWHIDYLPVNEHGEVTWCSPQNDIKMLSVGLANNETGVIQNVRQLATYARQLGIVVHTDAVQAVGKISVDFKDLGVQFLTISSHKIYGPQGAAAIVRNRAIMLSPLIDGGGQEFGLRSGTENVAAIVGFGKAAELARQELSRRYTTLLQLREFFETGLQQLPTITIIAKDAQQRLPNTSLIALPGIEGEMLLMNLDRAGFAVSSGSACASGTGEPSHVLQAMQVPAHLANSVVRISFGIHNTLDEVKQLLDFFAQQVSQLDFVAH